MTEKKIYASRLLRQATVARDVLEFSIQKPADFTFQAGQFIQFHIPQADSFVLRSYSVACPPSSANLEFLLKVLPNGKASVFFSNLPEGEAVQFEGPQGRFTCESGHASQKYFIATGTGLAPVMALIEDNVAKSEQKLALLFGVHAEPDLFWTDRLDFLRKKYDNFSYRITLSHPQHQAAWSGLTGRVTDHVPATAGTAGEYYICGNLEMIKDVRRALTARGVTAKSIHFEIF